MISFKNVNKWYGELHVLNDIDLEVARGEVVVVCGPSGSGKSTLIRCINRLEPIQKGELIVDGMAVHDRKINMTKPSALMWLGAGSKKHLAFMHAPDFDIDEKALLIGVNIITRAVKQFLVADG